MRARPAANPFSALLFAATLMLGTLGGCSSGTTPDDAPPPAAGQQATSDTATAAPAAPAPPTRTDQGRSVAERIEDASLAARVKTALVEDRRLRTFDFEPRVTGGRVTLAGNVATRAEGEAAAEVAGAVSDVDDVLNRLTVNGQQVAWGGSEATAEEQQVADASSGSTPVSSTGAPSEQAIGEGTYHTVQSGESLWAIASKYGTSVSRVQQLNDLRSNSLQAGERLLVKPGSNAPSSDASSSDASAGSPALADAGGAGQNASQTSEAPFSFYKGPPLPAREQPAEDAGATTADETQASGEEQGAGEEQAASEEEQAPAYYVVKSGESLWAIARKNGLSVARLKELNGLASNDLMPGDRLRVE